jgi:hypothetical protein
MIAMISMNLVNKEHDNGKLCRKSFDFSKNHTEKFGGMPNVKMGKPGGGGQYVVES